MLRSLLASLADALHRATCPSCTDGARVVIVGGVRHHMPGRARLPLDRILSR